MAQSEEKHQEGQVLRCANCKHEELYPFADGPVSFDDEGCWRCPECGTVTSMLECWVTPNGELLADATAADLRSFARQERRSAQS